MNLSVCQNKDCRKVRARCEKLERRIQRTEFKAERKLAVIGAKLEKAKEPTLGQLKRRAWGWISKFVRYSGEPVCFTCDRRSEPKELHTGHFYHGKLDWDLRNLRKQCPQCNVWKHGNLSEYRRRLTLELGPDGMAQLDADAHAPFKPTRGFYEEIAALYKLKFEMLGKDPMTSTTRRAG